MEKEIVLASESGRRSHILAECGIDHRIIPSGAKEDIDTGKHISGIVMVNAERKAMVVAARRKNAVVIGADTLVIRGKDIIGKPEDEDDARRLLKNFSGKRIEVYTGLCVMDTAEDRKATGFDRSELTVAVLTDRQVERCFRLLGPYDKAGGFSVEGVGSLLFDNIKGSYYNILGLPMMKLKELFEEIGLDILDYVKVG